MYVKVAYNHVIDNFVTGTWSYLFIYLCVDWLNYIGLQYYKDPVDVTNEWHPSTLRETCSFQPGLVEASRRWGRWNEQDVCTCSFHLSNTM